MHPFQDDSLLPDDGLDTAAKDGEAETGTGTRSKHPVGQRIITPLALAAALLPCLALGLAAAPQNSRLLMAAAGTTRPAPQPEPTFAPTATPAPAPTAQPTIAPTATPVPAPIVVGAPTFSDLTEDSVHVHAPALPDGTNSLTLQMKGAGESLYRIVETDLGGGSVTPVVDLDLGASYDFRYLATGPSPTATGPAARLTMPTSTASWQAGMPISCGGIRWPGSSNTIQGNQEGHLSSFLATDFDQLDTTVGGQVVSSRVHSDTCSYLWSATWPDGTPAGVFKNGINRGQGVIWIAPTTPGMVMLRLVVNDQNALNQGNRELGSRDDAGFDDPSLNFTTSISVLP